MRLSAFIVFPVFCLFITACSSPPEPKKDIVNQFHGLLPRLIQNDEGLLHGITLGMSLDSVKKFVPAGDSMSKMEENKYLFEGKLSANKEYSYECDFDDKGLNDITLDIYLKDEKNADSLFTDFSNYFSKRYGMPTESDGVTIWMSNEGKRPAKIILEKEEDYQYGKLTISFFDKNFDLPVSPGDSLILP
ncbi:MAG TPA: hypothetical protein VFJ43_06045, partial [Bacteroidia bacterium]|nr:hypothetical protein [Bacteroidia bacterium]